LTRWLQKHGRFWHYRFSVGGREYTGSTGAMDRATALIALEQTRREVVLGEWGVRKAPTLRALAESWIGTRGKAASKAHVRAAIQSLAALDPMAGLPLTHITTAIVDGWRGRYLEDHSTASANLVLRYLKMWMRWAMSEKLIKEMPYQSKAIKAQQRKRPVVPINEVESFLGKVWGGEGLKRHRNPQVPAAVAFAMMLGLRESEVLNARWEWLKDGVYTVSGNTKSRKIRAVPVPGEVLTALLHYLAANEHGPAKIPDLGLMFPTPDGKPHRQGWLRQALKRGGIGGLGMHRLRATFATLHLRAGTPLKEVQEMLGHADARTTLIYMETDQADKAKRQAELWKQA